MNPAEVRECVDKHHKACLRDFEGIRAQFAQRAAEDPIGAMASFADRASHAQCRMTLLDRLTVVVPNTPDERLETILRSFLGTWNRDLRGNAGTHTSCAFSNAVRLESLKALLIEIQWLEDLIHDFVVAPD